MRTFRLAHISDLHISGLHRRDNIRKTKRLLEHIARLPIDHLAVTGDIAADADPRDFKIARSLFAGSGWLSPEKLSVVVGNHDIFGGVHTAEDLLSFPGRCRATEYLTKLHLFRDTFHEAFEGSLIPSPRSVFPFAKVLGNVLLVGLNSISRYSRVKNPLGSNGRVDAGQFEEAEQILRSPLFDRMKKIVLIHHHFNKHPTAGTGVVRSLWGSLEKHTMKLRGKKELLRLLRGAHIDLVLHGHVHESGEYIRKGIRFLNGGASTMNDSALAALMNLVEVSDSGIDVSAALQVPAMLRLTDQHRPLEQSLRSTAEAA